MGLKHYIASGSPSYTGGGGRRMIESKIYDDEKTAVRPGNNGSHAALKKWEYDYVFYSPPSGLSVDYEMKQGEKSILARVNQMSGNSGWELLSVTPLLAEGFTSSLLFTLKRPLEE